MSLGKHGIQIPANLAADSDLDQDGIPLLLEYALDLSPTLPSQSPYLTGRLQKTPSEFSVTDPRLRSDLVYEVEGSENLQAWSISDIIVPQVAVGEEATSWM